MARFYRKIPDSLQPKNHIEEVYRPGLSLLGSKKSLCVLVAFFTFCVRWNSANAETVTLAPHTFTIPDGYELKRVTAPPLVQRPIHMCFDGSIHQTISCEDVK